MRKIIEGVEKRGDKALRDYSKKFDGIELGKFGVSEKRLERAFEGLSGRERKALEKAKRNIEFFAKKQLPRSWREERNGVTLGEKVIPIETVGIYVPAGRFPLVSTVLMCCVPARVAGVKRVVLCTPPRASEKVLAAAWLCGVREVFLVGGAQAIAAMAFGTESIPKVDKIVGPGNAFVSTAKRLLYGIVGIDMPAGPSEVLVFSQNGNAEWIAAELCAQAEHDSNARAWFVTTSGELAGKVEELTSEIQNIEIFRVESKEKAIELINKIAPEHLVLFDAKMLSGIRNAGSIFVGPYSAVAFGDYCSGTNHVLPTSGFARVRAALGSRDFVKTVAFQRVKRKAVKELALTAKTMAEMEGMGEHRKSIELRQLG